MQRLQHNETIKCEDNELHPLWRAVYFNDIETARSLLNDNVNPDSVTKGTSALWIAAQLGNFEIANMLIVAGADINFKHSSGQNILWTAAAN